MTVRDRTCRGLADVLMAYEDGELGRAERLGFEAHLAECPDCLRYLAGYRATVALGRRAFADEDAPGTADVPEALVEAVLAARRV